MGVRNLSSSTPEYDHVPHMTRKGLRYWIRSLMHSDIPQWVELAKETPTVDTVPCLHSWVDADPHGIKIAVTESGEIAGSCCIVLNGDHDEDGVCFGGVFYVQEKFSSQGIGQQLYKACYRQIGNRNGACNAVPGKLEVYRQSGFPIHETRFTTLEYYTPSWPLDFASFSDIPPSEVEICYFDESHLPKILAYDENIVRFRRRKNVRANIMEEGSKTLVAIGSGGVLVGFGTVKKTILGAVRIGPLYADSISVGEVLLRRLSAVPHEGRGGFVFVTTSANSAAKDWMRRLGVNVREECDRLYTKRRLDVDLGKVFALCDVNFSPF